MQWITQILLLFIIINCTEWALSQDMNELDLDVQFPEDKRNLGVAAVWDFRNSNMSTARVCGTPDLDLMISFSNGYVLLTRDFGYTWERTNAPRSGYRDCKMSKDGSMVVLISATTSLSTDLLQVQLAHNATDGNYNFSAWNQPGDTTAFHHIAMSENGTYIYLFSNVNYMYKSIDSGGVFYKYYLHEGSLEGGVCSADGRIVVYVGNYANTGLAYALYSTDYGASFLESTDSWINLLGQMVMGW